MRAQNEIELTGDDAVKMQNIDMLERFGRRSRGIYQRSDGCGINLAK